MLKDKKILLFALIVYVLSTGSSYLLFTKSPLAQKFTSPISPPTIDSSGEIVFDESLPKTEACPINGAKYSKQQKAWWEKHRPLGIMIENHENARPQSGLNSADIVYEAVAEGGITRTLAIYHCGPPVQVGPIRSARTYFLDWISEYGDSPLYVHVGGANTPGPADALGQINDYRWGSYNDLNQFSIGFPTFWRDYNRLGHATATEHTMYSTTSKLWDFAAKNRKLSNKNEDGTPWDEEFVPYVFKDDASGGERGSSQGVHIEFWENAPDYNVDWTFDRVSNQYSRKNGNVPHIDKNTGKQLTAKNLIILYMQERNANDGYENNIHLLYRNKGTGKAQVFMDGREIEATWSKKTRTDKTLLTDKNGNEIKFVRGRIWFHILPLEGVVRVK
ncbi:MAG: DUF3048 domain-containing protein [Candidatus Levybacteria bacterium]|nr:DUF3048 domain-containing protein [Candidatus Levybacteria bacterium]